ncbi:unnamed protein product [Callosobruchus maculatus]|uniref:Uncharacterized protein n=1 Tax=Callosobruchus maculatus TaxID=64391 RepID=A0A653C799_CALMS|nr:unnamed protein product [Callosobruchus maculatus]
MSQPNTPDRKQKRRESSNVAVHTPSPRTPGKAQKGGSSAKSAKKHALRTEDKEKSGNSEKVGSENEFESGAGQRQNLPEPAQPKTPNREQKQQEAGNAEVNETDNGVDEAVVDENPNETSVASKNAEVSSKGGDKYEKARNRKAQKAKKRQDTQKQISKKRKKSGRKNIRQEEEPAESPPEEQLPMESPPISVGDPSSNEGAVSDDDVVLIEKPIELIPVVDSDDEVEDIQLGVEKPLDEPQDSHADDAQSNATILRNGRSAARTSRTTWR